MQASLHEIQGLGGFDDVADRDAHIRWCMVRTTRQIIEYQHWWLYDGTKGGLMRLTSYPDSRAT